MPVKLCTISRRWRIALSALIASAAMLVATVAPATASASVLWNQHGNTVLVTCDLGCGSVGGTGTARWVMNGTWTGMYCYTNAGWYDGNYWSPVWFIGYVGAMPGLWFMHSSYVYYQTSVAHC